MLFIIDRSIAGVGRTRQEREVGISSVAIVPVLDVFADSRVKVTIANATAAWTPSQPRPLPVSVKGGH